MWSHEECESGSQSLACNLPCVVELLFVLLVLLSPLDVKATPRSFFCLSISARVIRGCARVTELRDTPLSNWPLVMSRAWPVWVLVGRGPRWHMLLDMVRAGWLMRTEEGVVSCRGARGGLRWRGRASSSSLPSDNALPGDRWRGLLRVLPDESRKLGIAGIRSVRRLAAEAGIAAVIDLVIRSSPAHTYMH